MILGSLAVGMAGNAYFEGLSWLDAFLNASPDRTEMMARDTIDQVIEDSHE